MGQSYWIIGIFWVIYFTSHSLLSADKMKETLCRWMPVLEKHYRLIYNLIARLGLLVYLVYFSLSQHTYLLSSQPILKLVGLMFASFGVILAKKAFSGYSLREFVGTKHELPPLATTGLQSKVRHPLYLATILIFIGLVGYMPTVENLVTLFCVLVYIPIGIYFEEQKLVKAYGQAYVDYQGKVPKLLPKWR